MPGLRMPVHPWAPRLRKEDGIVALIFVATQFFYRYVLHTPFIIDLTCFWQYLDLSLLQNDLWRSLYYLHSQPPLMNLLLGVMLKISAAHIVMLMKWTYFAAGLAAVLVLNRTCELLGIRRYIRMLAMGALCAFPTFFLYADWAYCTHLEFCLCCVVLYVMVRQQHTQELTFRDGWQLFIPLCLLGLLRAQWNLPVMAGVMLLFMRARAGSRRPYMQGAAVAVSPLVLVILKNYLVFGVFSASSWLGMNLSEVVVGIPPANELQELRQKGDISPFFPVDFKAMKADRARAYREHKGCAVSHAEHPALSPMRGWRRNYNYLPFIEGGQQDFSDSLVILGHYPWGYIRTVFKKMVEVAFTPSLSFVNCGFTLSQIKDWDTDYDGLPSALKSGMAAGSIVLYAVAPLALLVLAFRADGYIAPYRRLIYTAMFLVMSMYVISCAVNRAEQERMRWGMEPFYLVFATMVLESAARRKR